MSPPVNADRLAALSGAGGNLQEVLRRALLTVVSESEEAATVPALTFITNRDDLICKALVTALATHPGDHPGDAKDWGALHTVQHAAPSLVEIVGGGSIVRWPAPEIAALRQALAARTTARHMPTAEGATRNNAPPLSEEARRKAAAEFFTDPRAPTSAPAGDGARRAFDAGWSEACCVLKPGSGLHEAERDEARGEYLQRLALSTQATDREKVLEEAAGVIRATVAEWEDNDSRLDLPAFLERRIRALAQAPSEAGR